MFSVATLVAALVVAVVVSIITGFVVAGILFAVVLGVSPDPPKALAKFADKYGLPFTLLGDERHEVAEQYGVWVEKSMYGKTYMGMERSTFVIDPDGKVTHVFRKVKPAAHDAQVLAALGE